MITQRETTERYNNSIFSSSDYISPFIFLIFRVLRKEEQCHKIEEIYTQQGEMKPAFYYMAVSRRMDN